MPRIRTNHYEDARNQIIAAAQTIARKDGWDAVTLDAIAQQVGVTKPALYTYFKNREDLLREVFYVVVRNIRSSLKSTLENENDMYQIIRNLANLFFEQQETSGNIFFQLPMKMIRDLRGNEDVSSILDDCRHLIGYSLEQAQQAGKLSPLIDIAESTTAIIMMAYSISGARVMMNIDMAETKKIWITAIERILMLEPYK